MFLSSNIGYVSNKTTYQLFTENRDAGLRQAYERYGKKLYGYALGVWHCDEDVAWDLVYKTLYRTADQVANYRFENEEKFGGFVFRIFVNYLKNYHRDHPKKHTVVLNENLVLDESPETESIKHQLLRAELEKMEDWERILLLTRSQGMSYAAIAEYTGKPVDQLKVYYGRLKKRLETKLADSLMTIKHTDHGK